MSLLVKGRREGRDIVTVTPASAGWKFVGFSAHRLAPGESLEFPTERNEVCVVVLRGVVTIAAQGREWR
ncbi:MAG: 5-deoxy-glucuronate isomerase, partial [Burkholderiales bacterium]|nr:5-deoxy-glucuronate isomerase [Burkholderiales bacterium]